MLSQGGEFAFVLLSLASQLHVLPEELNRLLIIVVVLSMALTPTLAEFGKTLADRIVDPQSAVSSALPSSTCARLAQHGGILSVPWPPVTWIFWHLSGPCPCGRILLDPDLHAGTQD